MIASAIAAYIKENGIKQSFLCEQTGLTKHCVSTVLNGKRKLSVDEYGKICAALNLPYDYFFELRRKQFDIRDKAKLMERGLQVLDEHS